MFRENKLMTIKTCQTLHLIAIQIIHSYHGTCYSFTVKMSCANVKLINDEWMDGQMGRLAETLQRCKDDFEDSINTVFY